MHDIDRAMFEYEQEAYGGELHESQETYESLESSHEAEAYETELATELLEISSEQELEQFIGGLLSSAASAARSFANSSVGQALGGALKGAARQVLPQVGGIIGSAIGGGTGAQLGQKAGRWLGGQFELEGLSAEDRELELARAFVRTAGDATRIAERATSLPPQQAANRAVVLAARQHLPGLATALTSRPHPHQTSGRWFRHGNRIVLIGA